MKKIKILFFLFSFIVLPSITYGDCTKETIDYFKKIEEEYKIVYEFDKETKTYNVDLYTPEIDHYYYDVSNIVQYIEGTDTSDEMTIILASDVEPGIYEMGIYAICDDYDRLLKKINLELAPYNYYSEDPLCEGIEEFYLCQPTYGKEIDYDTFVSRVNTYKKSNSTNSKEKEKNENIIINKITEFITDNILEIIATIAFIIVIIVTIILTAKSIGKRRRLE